MTELRIGDQVIRYDREATAAAYASLSGGFIEQCGCVYCRNFAAQRETIFPSSFRALLDELGIDAEKEGEVAEYGPWGEGRHMYAGWFYLVGEVIGAGERNSSLLDVADFEFFFTGASHNTLAFPGRPRFALEFTVCAKWILTDGPDSGWHTLGSRAEGIHGSF